MRLKIAKYRKEEAHVTNKRLFRDKILLSSPHKINPSDAKQTQRSSFTVYLYTD